MVTTVETIITVVKSRPYRRRCDIDQIGDSRCCAPTISSTAPETATSLHTVDSIIWTGDDGVVQPGSIHGGGKVIELACHASDQRPADARRNRRATQAGVGRSRQLAVCAGDSSAREPTRGLSGDDEFGRLHERRSLPRLGRVHLLVIDIHREGEPAVIRYLRSPNTPTIRLGAMLPVGAENLITQRSTVIARRIRRSVSKRAAWLWDRRRARLYTRRSGSACGCVRLRTTLISLK